MTEKIIIGKDYNDWLGKVKSIIRNSQIKAALSVNEELIRLYWDLGRQIKIIQSNSKYGDGIIGQVAADLKNEFPDMSGFSRSNLFACKRFYLFYSDEKQKVQQVAGQLEPIEKVQQVAGQFDKALIHEVSSIDKLLLSYCCKVPWWHNVIIIQKSKSIKEALFYIQQTISNNWSRSVLQMQIESNLYARQGKAISNFELTLPKPQSDLANQLLKDPYNLNFLTLEQDIQELDLERQLVKNITQFLLELGKGFAYMGRQYELQVGTKEYRLDLLFYHVRLKSYVVIELKMKEFEPEFIGKLNFYLSAIDSLVKAPEDGATIGMLLCKTKDNLNVEFALRDVNKPIGVSAFTFNELPVNIKNAMPTVEELERELFKDETHE